MNEDLHTLSGAYALHALPEYDERLFEEHMVRCESCLVEVRGLRETAARLGLAAAQDPPPALRARVMSRIAEVRQEPPMVESGASAGLHPPNHGQAYHLDPGQGAAYHLDPGQGAAHPQNPGQGPAYPQSPGQGQAYPESPGQGLGRPPDPGRGYPGDGTRTYARDPGRAFPQDPGRAHPQGPGQGYPEDSGRGYPQDPGQGYSQGGTQVYPQDPNRMVPRDPGQGHPPEGVSPHPQDSTRLHAPDSRQVRPPGPVQGLPQGGWQGQPDDRTQIVPPDRTRRVTGLPPVGDPPSEGLPPDRFGRDRIADGSDRPPADIAQARRSSRRRPPRARWGTRVAATLATVSTAAAVALGYLTYDANQQLDQIRTRSQTIAAVLAAPDARTVVRPVTSGGSATIVRSRSAGRMVFTASGLSRLPASKDYELWLMGPDGVRPAGLLQRAGDGTVVPVIALPLASEERVGLTVEPAGGSAKPTTQPILLAKLPAA